MIKLKKDNFAPLINEFVNIFPVYFKRNKNSKYEKGIAIGNLGDIKIIIDNQFKPVKAPIWSYNSLPNEGLLPIKL